uniref:Reverse transcriptase Ty1/copia-type domain-containing protein n=1 Tax=Fagus sylvatica TaxID=28930 RepID=A0A2N9FZ58_FAGSY
MTTRSQNQIIKPKIPTDGTVRYPVSKALLTVTESSSIDAEPTCFTLAVKSPAWRATMNLEFDALLKNQTWQLVPPHSSQNLIGCKWVFRTERKADGSVERHKARLVAKGFHQQPGVNYDETYSPVVKPYHGTYCSLHCNFFRSDSSLFIYKDSSMTMYVLIYVDDIIITCSQPILVQLMLLLQSLTADFAVKDLGNLNWVFLGVEVIPNSQVQWVPFNTYNPLTRPDIAFCVNKLSQFMHKPTLLHWQSVKRLLRYLKLTIQFGIQIYRNSNTSIHAFSDADWAGSKDDRRSTGSYCVFLGHNLISWSCKKQATVA